MADGAFRIGAGAGFAGDRYEPAEVLAERGRLDALVFECLAERTIALAQAAKGAGTGAVGYDPRILRRLERTLPHLAGGRTVVVTNAGAADPHGAALATRDLVDRLGLGRFPVAAVTGDDVLDRLPPDAQILGTDGTVGDLGDRVVSANAYLGMDGILAALEQGAAIVLTGRVGDASLFLAPLVHGLGWDAGDLGLLAAGSLVGHLLECAGQLTGGYFADGGRKTVPGLATLGFPFADVGPDGAARYGKVAGTGGRLDRSTVLEQLLYEIDDPRHYITPDVILDLTGVRIEDQGGDVVRVAGARPLGVPDTWKVSVGVRDGLLATGEISYAGRGCVARARLAESVVRERWSAVLGHDSAPSSALIGVDGTRPWWQDPDAPEPAEVRLRLSARTFERQEAVDLIEEVEALYTNGPAGGGGVTTSIRETLGVVSTLLPRAAAEARVEVLG